MTRSDILLDTNEVIKEMEKKNISSKIINHVSSMADTLDDLWTVMLTFENYDEFKKMGNHMRTLFDRKK